MIKIKIFGNFFWKYTRKMPVNQGYYRDRSTPVQFIEPVTGKEMSGKPVVNIDKGMPVANHILYLYVW